MNILIIGQCTLHWGRMEYGNVGNYYIIEPFIRELHHVFPDANIKTTFQMTDGFCKRERITRLPMELYYSWTDADLPLAQEEIKIAETFKQCGKLKKTTPYIEVVLDSDLILDFSGDIWGDNANLIGKNRFVVGLLKDRVAQLLGKPTAMLTGSPGPFKDQSSTGLAKTVFSNFDLVTNRESISKNLLKGAGFNISKTHSLTCPAFLFEPEKNAAMQCIYKAEKLNGTDRPKVGFILCGWNMLEGPYNKHPREDQEYKIFAEAVEYLELETRADIFLLSHSNGFDLPPNFKMIHGRDFQDAKRLYEILIKRGKLKNLHLIEGIYQPAQIKAIIGQFDMLVSGRVHAAVAGLSQFVPTVIIDYGHEPKAHKLQGFADVAGVGDYVANPNIRDDIKTKIRRCWTERQKISEDLEQHIPVVQSLAKKNFELLPDIIPPHNAQ